MLSRFLQAGAIATFAILPALCAGRVRAQTPLYPNNAVWLPDYNVLTDPSGTFAQMQGYSIHLLLPIDGDLTATGMFGGSTNYAKDYLNAINSYELKSGYKFTVLIYLYGDLTSSDSDYVNISNATIQNTIASECAKLTSTTISGSYIAGANRAFDGVMLDLEPGGVYDSSTPFQQLGVKIKTSMGSGKVVGFYTPAYNTTQSDWAWNITEYYYMDGYSNADFLMVDTYDSGITSASAYQTYVQNQTYNVLRSVSGIGYDDPSGHPVPSHKVQVFIGFPGGNASGQNVPAAAKGALAGLNQVDATSATFFGGAHCFQQINGNASDGTDSMSYATDWPNFNTNWLGTLAANPVPSESLLNPNSAAAGTSNVTLTVSGANFVSSSVVQWSGTALPTTYANAETLTATIPSSDLATAGTANVTVYSPPQAGSGGGTTSSLTFTITP